MRAVPARAPTPAEQARVMPHLQALAPKYGCPVPELLILDTPVCNAMAMGHSPQHARVLFTTGILDLLDDDELEAVTAHELAHVANQDTRVAVLSESLLGGAKMFFALGMIIFFAVLAAGIWCMASDFGEGGWGKLAAIMAGLCIICLAVGIFILIQIWTTLSKLADIAVTRQREWLADATAAAVTGKPLALASALSKLEQHDVVLPAGSQMAQALCIAGFPLSGKWWDDLWSTHPSPARRIAKLRQMALLQ